jgi:alkylation response protein AidB-like acyl-CoA dehydrogenase
MPSATISQGRSAIPRELIEKVRASSAALDTGHEDTRANLGFLGRHGLLDLGAPFNSGGQLPEMVRVIAEISAECMSTGFSLWAHRMTLEYLTLADTANARQHAGVLQAGRTLGVSGMAAAFRDLARCGEVELDATADSAGHRLNGRIPWATNLHEDSLLVTAARAGTGEKLIVALPLSRSGITIGPPYSLMGLGSTRSSAVSLDEVRIKPEDILTDDFENFLSAARPTFLILQTAMCVGLARSALSHARANLTGLNTVFTADVDDLSHRLDGVESNLLQTAAALGSVRESADSRRDLLSLRLAGATLATAATTIEVKTAGGRGYACGTPANRRFREAAFIPVQSPTEAQLRWELARHDDPSGSLHEPQAPALRPN